MSFLVNSPKIPRIIMEIKFLHIRQRTTTYREERPHSPIAVRISPSWIYIFSLVCTLSLFFASYSHCLSLCRHTHSHTRTKEKPSKLLRSEATILSSFSTSKYDRGKPLLHFDFSVISYCTKFSHSSIAFIDFRRIFFFKNFIVLCFGWDLWNSSCFDVFALS